MYHPVAAPMSGQMFLLVLVHLGSPRQNAAKQLSGMCVETLSQGMLAVKLCFNEVLQS